MGKKKNIMKKAVGVTAAAAVLIPMVAGSGPIAAADSISKSESVYVNQSVSGAVENETVSDWLHSSISGSTVSDIAALSGISNLKGSEKPEINGSDITWHMKGKDLYYSGTADKQVPVVMKIQFFMNGNKMSPSEIAGKTGSFEMKVSFQNRNAENMQIDGQTRKVYTPFLCAATVNLPKKYFKNVAVNVGSVQDDGVNQVLAFVSVPGLTDNFSMMPQKLNVPEELDITADAENFQLGPVMALVTPATGLDSLKNTNDVNGLISGLDKLYGAGLELRTATGTLSDGEKQFAAGMQSLYNGVVKAGSSFGAIDGGAKKLQSAVDGDAGLSKLQSAAGQLSSGAKTLSSGLSQLQSQFKNGSAGNTTLKDGIDGLNGGAGQLSDGLSQLQSQFKNGSAGNSTLKDLSDNLSVGTAQLSGGAQQLQQQLTPSPNGSSGNIADGADSLSAGTSSYSSLADNTLAAVAASEYTADKANNCANFKNAMNLQAKMAATYLNQAYGCAVQKKDYTAALNAATVFVNSYDVMNTIIGEDGNTANFAADMASGKYAYSFDPSLIGKTDAQETAFINANFVPAINSKNIVKSGAALSSGSNTLAQQLTSGAFKKGVDGLAAGIGASNDTAASKTLFGGINSLSDQMKSGKNSDGTPTLYSAVDSLSTGASKLYTGTKSLESEINNGGALNNAVNGLSGGASKLSNGLSQLNTGSAGLSTLKNGIDELSAGVSLFQSAGISPLENGAAKLSDASAQLSAGSDKLNSGMSQFFDQGLSKLGGNDANNVKAALDVKDAAIKLSDSYDTFSGAGDGMKSSVKFIIKTDEIKAPAVHHHKSAAKPQKDTGFFGHIAAFFKKLF